MDKNVGTVERIVSLALGGAALAAFLRRPGLSRAPLAAAAAGFLFRGGTGHCPVKAAVGEGGLGGGADSETSGRKQAGSPEESWREEKDLVQEASEESFPASDPPSFNPGIAD